MKISLANDDIRMKVTTPRDIREARIHYFYNDLGEKTGYDNGFSFPSTQLFVKAAELYDEGFQVMIKKISIDNDQEIDILWVDEGNSAFKQR